jgi:DNA-binding response OmpR family regulator
MNPRRSQRVNISTADSHAEPAPLVLLVDDDVAVRDILAWVIQGAGYTPVTASGAAGFRQLTEMSDRIALVLLDLTMHDLDGFCFRELQLAHPKLAEVPTIVMSGRPVEEDEREKLRANEYIWKPIRMSDLRALVSEHARPVPGMTPHHATSIKTA